MRMVLRGAPDRESPGQSLNQEQVGMFVMETALDQKNG